MVVGFNHNFRYKGEVYHIQTEDSGVKSPNIVTLLYHGGTILASKKTSYADIARVDNLDQVVEELMKEQHKEMLRRLKAGEFDAVIERFQSGRKVTPQILTVEEASASALVAKPVTPEPLSAPVAPAPKPEPPAAVAKTPPAAVAKTPPAAVAKTPPAAVAKTPPAAVAKTPPAAVAKTPPAAATTKSPPSAVELSLDEVILSYLMGDDK